MQCFTTYNIFSISAIYLCQLLLTCDQCFTKETAQYLNDIPTKMSIIKQNLNFLDFRASFPAILYPYVLQFAEDKSIYIYLVLIRASAFSYFLVIDKIFPIQNGVLHNLKRSYLVELKYIAVQLNHRFFKNSFI